MNSNQQPSRRVALARLGQVAVAGASVAAPWINVRAQTAKVIRLAHHVSLQSEQHKAAENFAKLVETYSKGALTVRVLPAAQAGGQREAIESVSLGALEMAYGESGLYANYAPRLVSWACLICTAIWPIGSRWSTAPSALAWLASCKRPPACA